MKEGAWRALDIRNLIAFKPITHTCLLWAIMMILPTWLDVLRALLIWIGIYAIVYRHFQHQAQEKS